MKLNFDCVRDILIYIEDSSTFLQPALFRNVRSDNLYNDSSDSKHESDSLFLSYGYKSLYYHLNYCYKADLIEEISENIDCVSVNDLSPKGHDFLANIRNDNIWNNTKEVASKVGSKSLEALVQISSNVITTIIQKQFNL